MDVKIVFVTVAAVVFLLRHADIRNNAQNASFLSYSLENFLCGAPLNKFDDSFPPTWRNFPGVSAAELFNFITHPNVVEKWFSLVSLFTSADHKPLVVGKVFRAVVGTVVFHFHVEHLQESRCLTLTSDFLLKPTLSVVAIDLKNNSQVWGSRLAIRLHFGRTSWIFRNLIGKAFLWVSRRKIEASLWKLQWILEEMQTYPLFLYQDVPPW